MSISTVGVIGLGRMGGPMASHLLRAGFTVPVYDIAPAAMERLVGGGALATRSPHEVAEQSEAVVVMLVDDQQVTEVMTSQDGLLEGAKPGTVVILCSSLRPNTVRDLQPIAKAKGVEVVDAPVTGGEWGAVEGKLTFLVGASEAALQQIDPVLRAMGTTIEHVGPAGSGQVAKAVHNVLLWAELAVTSEALLFADRLGVPSDAVRRALRSCPGNNWALARWEDTDNIPWAAKDLSSALAVAEEIGAQMPVTGLVRELLKGWSRAQHEGRVTPSVGPTE
jgi:3-hydroxyisobutyrate dehydrogenase-like beta-hydroxyacid dehydrogenase